MIPIISSRAGSSRVFRPTWLSGLQLWFDASQETYADAATVPAAIDRSGNGRDFSSPSSGNRPTFRATGGPNSRPCYEHDGSNDYVGRASFGAAYTSGEVFIVLKRTTTSNKGFWSFLNTAGGNEQYYPFAGNVYEDWGTTSRKDNISSGVTLTNWHLYNIESATNSWKARWNGTNEYSTGTNTVSFATDFGDGNYYIGGNRNLVTFADFSWAELIFFNRVLASGERTALKAYLAAKYALTIA